jgi:ABC-type multidrug transport system ATPase subunit
MTEIKVYGPETPEEKEIRIKQKARKYLETDEDVAGSPTLRNIVEETLEPNTMEAFYDLLKKLRNHPYYNKLVSYKGDSEANAFVDRLINIIHGRETPEERWERIRERTQAFLKTDEDIPKSETLKKLAEEAIVEDTMDGYYNLLKNFRKKYDVITKLKKSEENADDFLKRLTDVIHDKKITN